VSTVSAARVDRFRLAGFLKFKPRTPNRFRVLLTVTPHEQESWLLKMPASKRIRTGKPSSDDLNAKFQDLKRVLYPRQDVVGRLDRLIQVTQRLGKSRARDVHELVLNQWKKHNDVSRLDAFLTEKIAERTKIYEAQNRPPRRKPPCIHKINYGRMAVDHLREAYSPEQLSNLLDQPESLCSLGPILFKKWDDEFHTKFPDAHKDVNEIKKWRQTNFHLKTMVLRALPANVRHNIATRNVRHPSNLEVYPSGIRF
jgi:hypothetical protein